MAAESVAAGTTSYSTLVFIQDSSAATGIGLGGVAPAGGSLLSGTTCYYTFGGTNATSVVVSLTVLAAVTTAWTSAGIVEIDSTHMKGWYRLDIPNAALATSKGQVVGLHIQGGTNMAPCPVKIELTGWNNQDGIHGGMTAFPNVASGSTGAIPTVGTGSNQIQVDGAGNAYANLTKILGTTSAGAAGYVGIDWGHVNAPTTTVGLSGTTIATVTNQLTASAIATGVWQDAVSGDFTTASSIGKALYISNVAPGGSGGHMISGSNAGTTTLAALTVTGALTATGGITGNITGNLTGTVSTVTNLTNAPTAGDLTSTMKTSVTTACTAATPTVHLTYTDTLPAFGSALTSSSADTAITVGQALHCAAASIAGQQTTSGTTYTTKTSAGTSIRAFTLDQNPNPNNRT